MNYTFKLGDRVRVVKMDNSFYHLNEVGTVVESFPNLIVNFGEPYPPDFKFVIQHRNKQTWYVDCDDVVLDNYYKLFE